ncbi:hypothetical protein LINPERHAP1_LOCUS39544 [Linum perenne]
MFMLLGHFC